MAKCILKHLSYKGYQKILELSSDIEQIIDSNAEIALRYAEILIAEEVPNGRLVCIVPLSAYLQEEDRFDEYNLITEVIVLQDDTVKLLHRYLVLNRNATK